MQDNPIHSEKVHQTERGLYISDIVYGANDGVITTFAIISGAAGATLTPETIIILGLASLVADGISMGMSNYLAISSRLAYQKQERAREYFEIENFPEQEKKEVRDILTNWGLDGEELETTLGALTRDKDRWVDIMMREELGIFEDRVDSPLKHGAITTTAFILAGALPLVPYLFGVNSESQFTVSLTATAISLFVVGAARTFVTGASLFRSGFQMLLVGGFAAFAAFLVGAIVKSVFGVYI